MLSFCEDSVAGTFFTRGLVFLESNTKRFRPPAKWIPVRNWEYADTKHDPGPAKTPLPELLRRRLYTQLVGLGNRSLVQTKSPKMNELRRILGDTKVPALPPDRLEFV